MKKYNIVTGAHSPKMNLLYILISYIYLISDEKEINKLKNYFYVLEN